MNLTDIKELVKMLDETEISEFNLESDGVKISIKRGSQVPVIPQMQTLPYVVSSEPQAAPAVKKEAAKAVEKEDEGLVPIIAPMVGTFYRSPAPDAPPYVEEGQSVRKGQVTCIIEAMKLMNEIESEVSGTIAKVLVENGQPVEYGQTIFLVRQS